MFEIKKTEYVNKTFRLEKTLVEKLSECASNNNLSVNALVAQCCEYALNNMAIDDKKNSNEWDFHSICISQPKINHFWLYKRLYINIKI